MSDSKKKKYDDKQIESLEEASEIVWEGIKSGASKYKEFVTSIPYLSTQIGRFFT
jgi:hypothetical protein